ncbi:MAG: ABC transporter ATP-binding protein, partial [Coprothermobacterota bacterium]|nr:ABC transporter ATP-binding protein [Coprothermobacterota bacterium]
MNDNLLLDICNLQVWYRVYGGYLKVLDGVNFHIDKGEKVGLVGETGCGKTTTMKAVLRILPDRDTKIPGGEIRFQGEDILQMNGRDLQKIRSQGIAMIFQDPTAALNPVFTIGQQIGDVIRFSLASRKSRRREKTTIKSTAMQALKEVSLPDQERMLGNYPIQLSGGMRQRVCISMAITTPRQLLIADEPGTSLDVTIQDQILRLLRDLVEKRGTSIILITHSLGVAREMTDRIYVMYSGSMVEVAQSADLFERPLHPYTLGLLASVPKITGGGI